MADREAGKIIRGWEERSRAEVLERTYETVGELKEAHRMLREVSEQCDSWRQRAEEAEAQAAAIRDVLSKCEWVWSTVKDAEKYCVVCDGYLIDGHKQGCKLAAVLKSNAGCDLLERLRQAESDVAGLNTAGKLLVEELKQERDEWKAKAESARREALIAARDAMCGLCATQADHQLILDQENTLFHVLPNCKIPCQAATIRALLDKEGR